MDPARWQQIKALFEAALDVPAAERSAFLDDACAGDEALRRDVESLLASDGASTGFLDTPALVDVPEPAAEPLGGGARVGSYRLDRELGRGGMGTVFLAHRADGGFRQTVALKLARRGLDDDELLSRFRYERQILASLDHAHIARLYDGGMTDDGRPYFAMEFVDGLPVTDYCDRHRLSTRQRLQLFCTVCDTVAYAHRALVIHRDIKPSNILVTEDGTVKLLDFGIAKLLDEDALPEAVPRTRTGLRLMTPEYAAPEQVRGNPVTTATDVYQLGVLLYELLTGHRPYRLHRHRPYEIEQAILENEPTRPSSAVLLRDREPPEDPTPETISQARSTSVEGLRRRLAGDLDTIVLKALRKEPERRYGSADQLREDLLRHLSGRPVTARPDTPGYRLSKFIRRHRAGVATAAGVVLALLAGLGTTAWQARVAATERDRARAEAVKAEQINTFLQDMLSSADPGNEGRDVKVADVLDDAVRQLDSSLVDQPDAAAAIKNTLGVTYRSLGLYDEAEPLLQDALAIRRRLHRTAHPDLVTTLSDLAHLLRLKGDYDAAEPLIREALALNRSLYGEHHQKVATSLNDLAVLLYYRGDFQAAEPLQRRALAIDRAVLGNDHLDVAVDLENLATLLADQGNLHGADSLYRESLTIRRARLGDRHLDVAWTLHNLATVRHDLGDYEEAEALYRQTLAIRREQLGETHPDYVTSLSALGSLLATTGDLKDAEPLLRHAVDHFRDTLGPDHPRLARALGNLADFLYKKGAYAEAESVYREAAALWRRTTPEHPNHAIILEGLGDVLVATGRPEEAEPVLREALAVCRAVLPEHHWLIAQAESQLGHVLTTTGRYAEADSLLQAAHAVLTDALGPDHPTTRRAARYLDELSRRRVHPSS